MSERVLEGGCQCGAIRYRLRGEPVFAAVCHCQMCRRAHAAPSVAWAMFAEDQVQFHGEPLKQYRSSAEAQRGFCAQCGTQLSFSASFLPGLIDVAIGSLDDAAQIQPQLHYWCASKLPWVAIGDDWPQHAELPPFD